MVPFGETFLHFCWVYRGGGGVLGAHLVHEGLGFFLGRFRRLIVNLTSVIWGSLRQQFSMGRVGRLGFWGSEDTKNRVLKKGMEIDMKRIPRTKGRCFACVWYKLALRSFVCTNTFRIQEDSLCQTNDDITMKVLLDMTHLVRLCYRTSWSCPHIY